MSMTPKEVDPHDRPPELHQTTPAADAFARVCKYGNEMIGYGILMAMSALAIGFGLELGWSPLWILGAVMLWVFGCSFSDARKRSNAAVAHNDAVAFSFDHPGGDNLMWLAYYRRHPFVIALERPASDDDHSQASQGL